MNFGKFVDRDFTFAIWCSGCNAEQATDSIDVYVNDEWVELKVGPQCLTKLREQGRIDV